MDLVPLPTRFLIVCTPNSLNGGRQLLFLSKGMLNVVSLTTTGTAAVPKFGTAVGDDFPCLRTSCL